MYKQINRLLKKIKKLDNLTINDYNYISKVCYPDKILQNFSVYDYRKYILKKKLYGGSITKYKSNMTEIIDELMEMIISLELERNDFTKKSIMEVLKSFEMEPLNKHLIKKYGGSSVEISSGLESNINIICKYFYKRIGYDINLTNYCNDSILSQSDDVKWFEYNRYRTQPYDNGVLYIKNIESDLNYVYVYHGTIIDYSNILKNINTIDWEKGGGMLNKGFYVTLNPNEAKYYAVLASFIDRWGGDNVLPAYKTPIVIKYKLKKIDNLKIICSEYDERYDELYDCSECKWENDTDVDGLSKSCTYINQFSGRTQLINNLEFIRIYLLEDLSEILLNGIDDKLCQFEKKSCQNYYKIFNTDSSKLINNIVSRRIITRFQFTCGNVKLNRYIDYTDELLVKTNFGFKKIYMSLVIIIILGLIKYEY